MSELERKASKAYSDMKYRCGNKNSRLYYRYGERGISVQMGKRDFMAWFIHHGKKFKRENPGTRFAVGRIDHDKDYMFSNIELISHADNCLEAIIRNRGICFKCKKEIESSP